jgi:hypothetical protein
MSKPADTSWLDVPDWLDDKPSVRIESTGKLTGERKRAPSMAKKLLGKSRTWACDGEYVYFRRKQSNPATLERHNKFIASGHFKHVQTQDDIEIFQLQEASPFKREPENLTVLTIPMIRRAAVKAGVARDWGLFVDCISELATKFKSQRWEVDGRKVAPGDPFVKDLYEEALQYIFLTIWKSGGPLQAEIDAGVQSVRARRGDATTRLVTLPPAIQIATGQVGRMSAGARRMIERNASILH